MQRMNGETKTRRASEREREREREGRVNNLHSDESIVLRQAHATVPIMALRLVDAPTTGLRPLSLLFSFPLGEEPRHRRSYTYIYTSISIYVYLYIYTYSFHPTVALLSSSLAHFCADTDRLQAPFHPENFNYNRNYPPKKVLPECPRTNNPTTRSVADHPSNNDKWRNDDNDDDDDDDGWCSLDSAGFRDEEETSRVV